MSGRECTARDRNQFLRQRFILRLNGSENADIGN